MINNLELKDNLDEYFSIQIYTNVNITVTHRSTRILNLLFEHISNV